MSDVIYNAVNDFEKAEMVYSKFITANDSGKTGAHQAGFHISKSAWSFFFDKPGIKGENKDRFIEIIWQNDFRTQSRFIYYGVGTRNEYRLTRFGHGFPLLNDDNVGDLMIFYRFDRETYKAYSLSTDSDIELFFASTGISITDINTLIEKQVRINPEDILNDLITGWLKEVIDEFPSSKVISELARGFYFKATGFPVQRIIDSPDKVLLEWIDTEFKVFKSVEKKLYLTTANKGFKTVEELIETANTLLNRRKSRAGKALENHLSRIFDSNTIRYEMQVKTEGNKRPDFIFPDGRSYHDKYFNIDDLYFLGAKTTCKDRWRQILNEANRIEVKHLMTLQQGISSNQLDEMRKHNVVLVVPEQNKKSFPKEKRDEILSLSDFIQIVKSRQ